MFYYKRPDGALIESEEKNDCWLQFDYVELTEKQYNEELEKIREKDVVEQSELPTYEELEEENARLLYQLLTGEEFE